MPWLGHSYAMRNSRPVLSVVLLTELAYGIQDLTVDVERLGVDKDESDHTGLSAAIDPIVDRAALHEHVARLQMDDRVIELHVDLIRHDDGIINGIRPVVSRRNPGRKLDDAKDRAVVQCRTDLPLSLVGVACVVYGKRLRGPDHTGRPPGRPETRFLETSSIFTTARPFASCPVTTRRT